MVGYLTSQNGERLSALDHSIAGSFSGMVTRAVCQPFDVLKIRFQLQLEPIRRTSKSSKYRSLLQALSVIVREEGITALWRGHIPAQGLSMLYGLIQFVSYELLTQEAYRHLPVRIGQDKFDRLPVNFVCGSVSGTLATVASLPLDIVRTRVIAQGEPKIYHNTMHAVNVIIRNEGFLGLYRSFVPTVLQIAPYSGLVFLFYDFTTAVWKDRFPDVSHYLGSNALESFICGGLAGVGAKAILCPLDLLKKRLQMIGFEEARRSFGQISRYRGLIHCAQSIIAQEGYSSFYKGFVPTVLKAAAVNSCCFFCYEQICGLLKLFHQQRRKQ